MSATYKNDLLSNIMNMPLLPWVLYNWGGDIMSNKNNKTNDNKTTNKKKANPITMEVKSNAKEAVKGLPNV